VELRAKVQQNSVPLAFEVHGLVKDSACADPPPPKNPLAPPRMMIVSSGLLFLVRPVLNPGINDWQLLLGSRARWDVTRCLRARYEGLDLALHFGHLLSHFKMISTPARFTPRSRVS